MSDVPKLSAANLAFIDNRASNEAQEPIAPIEHKEIKDGNKKLMDSLNWPAVIAAGALLASGACCLVHNKKVDISTLKEEGGKLFKKNGKEFSGKTKQIENGITTIGKYKDGIIVKETVQSGDDKIIKTFSEGVIDKITKNKEEVDIVKDGGWDLLTKKQQAVRIDADFAPAIEENQAFDTIKINEIAKRLKSDFDTLKDDDKNKILEQAKKQYEKEKIEKTKRIIAEALGQKTPKLKSYRPAFDIANEALGDKGSTQESGIAKGAAGIISNAASSTAKKVSSGAKSPAERAQGNKVIQEASNVVSNAGKKMQGTANNLAQKGKETIEGVRPDGVSGAAESVKGTVKKAGETVKKGANTVRTAVQRQDEEQSISNAVSSTAKKVSSGAKSAAERVQGSKVIQEASNVVSNAGKKMQGTANNLVQKGKETLENVRQDGVSGATESVKGTVKKAGDTFKKGVNAAKTAVQKQGEQQGEQQSRLTSLKQGAEDAAQKAREKAGNFLNRFKK